MCGRYVIYDQLTQGNLVLLGHDIPANFNVAPTTDIPIIRRGADHTRELYMARWGLIPNWAKDLKIPPFFNARADKLVGNKVFWPCIEQRCLIPMAGFYEWDQTNKQPYFIQVSDEPLFYTAGLWNRWSAPDGQQIDSATIITTDPNNTLADIHHRMPVIVAAEHYDTWLDTGFATAQNLLKPYPRPMHKYPVDSKQVNNARNNTIHCLEPMHDA